MKLVVVPQPKGNKEMGTDEKKYLWDYTLSH
jgi:hypothetical protein